jgi:ADP-ribose pyrophosphatase YjhB (NUDIX family)
MASDDAGNYVVVKLPFGRIKASYLKLVIHRETRTGKSWFLAGIVLLCEELVDAAVCELFEETDLTLTVDDLTMLSGVVVRVLLSASKKQLVYMYSAYVHVPYVNANPRTPANVE